MRIVALLPSQEALASAGARIRYQRLASAIAEQGASLELVDIAAFDPRIADFEILIVSKCYDARSLVAAELAVRRGAIVGVDLFDDYFSQPADSRLARFRSWLEQMLHIANFATFSTQEMASVVERYRRDLPVRVVRDPAPALELDTLRSALVRKLAAARAEQRLRLCWFGMGDNPHFAVGLSDLAAFSGSLTQLSSLGIAVELSILTNARALDAGGLAAIASLPIPASVEHWSQAREEALLRDSFAVFLPVNAQTFSRAKSNNRAVAALCAGCQVLSAGYPLYADFGDFIYRQPGELIADLAGGQMRLSAGTAGELQALMGEKASASSEAGSLLDFLRNVPRRESSHRNAPLIVVHGAATNGAAQAMAQAGGGLSVATPFCSAPLEFDAVFEARAGADPVLLVSRKALSRLVPEQRRSASAFGRIGGRKFWQLGTAPKKGDSSFDWAEPAVPLQLAIYNRTMQSILAQLQASFGAAPIILETSALPLQAPR